MYRHLMLLGLCVAMALGVMTPLGASGGRADVATLRKITSRVDDRAGIVSIEASDPVPYVASQPDPHTFVVDLREVNAAGFADRFTPDPRNPIAAVKVETARSSDGVDVARVRLTLQEAMRPRVRSSRNVIYVEADRPERGATTGSDVVSLAGPASVIHDVRATRRGAATAVTLRATGRLFASSIEESKEGPRVLTLNLPNVTAALPDTTDIKQGPVERVRVALSPKSAVITQVMMEMSRRAPYRVESSDDGKSLTVVFDDPVADPIAAMTSGRPAARVAPESGIALQQAPPASPAPVPAPGPAAPAQDQAPRPATPSTAAPPAAPITQGVAPAGTQRFTGHPVSLDFQGADLRAVLRTFAEISGLNIVIDPTIQGTVDVSLRDVPWDQALDIILRANKLGYEVDGTVVRIAPLSVFQAENEERKKLADSQASAVPLDTKEFSLSYAKAEDISSLLKASQLLSPRGNPTIDTRTNTLIVSDTPDRMDAIGALITRLDRPQPQVEIEARIVQTTRDFARQLGVQWGFGGRASTALGNTLPMAFPNQGSITGRTGALQGPASPDTGDNAANTAVNLGVNGATSAIGLALGSVNGAVNLDVALSALEQQGQGRVLSTPRVATQNNVEAEITQGVQIPIQTVANNTVTVTFRDAALTLKVTPQITAANTVIMQISVENASPDFSRSVNNIPPIDTQRANTRVLVSDGETTVIGGIYVSNQQAEQARTPGLYRLPLLGWLFKHDTISDQSRELLIFITPKIMRL